MLPLFTAKFYSYSLPQSCKCFGILLSETANSITISNSTDKRYQQTKYNATITNNRIPN